MCMCAMCSQLLAGTILKLMEIKDPKLHNFYKEMLARGGTLAPWYTFLCKISKFGIPHVQEFATDSKCNFTYLSMVN